ncbi:MAG: protein kinase domain-containing protein [Blastocatellia bacterium]
MKKIDEATGLTEYATRLESSSESQSGNESEIEYLYLTPIDTGSGEGGGISEGETGVSVQPAGGGRLAASTGVKTAPARRPAVSSPPVAASPASTFTIGHYEVDRAIGRGGMGDVYLARDTRLGRPVAVKLLRADYKPTELRVRRFHQEARAVCALNHPNIVTIYEVGESNGAPFIVSEFIEGLTLRRLIPPHGMKVHLALDIAIQITSALSAAHQAGIVHRDIKPENVMVRGDGYVKVLDFGLAKLSDALEGRADRSHSPTGSAPGTVLGTISYMSPEQARGLDVDGRTDIFSLGIVLYEMITGRKPFTGPATNDVLAAILNKEPARASGHVPDLPEEVQWIIDNAICKNLDARYPTINEMMRDLREVKDELAMRSRQERKSLVKELGWPEMARTGKPSGRALVSVGPVSAPLVRPPLRGEILDLSRETVSLQERAIESFSRSSKDVTPQQEERESRKRTGYRLPVTIAIGAIGAIGLMLAGLLAAVAVYRFYASAGPLTFGKITLSRITSSGRAGPAAISPDGRYLAYVQTEIGGREGVWLRQINTATAVQILPPAEAAYHHLKFSRDGNFLYFVMNDRTAPARAALYQMPTLGGASRNLFAMPGGKFELSPDGKRLAYFRSSENGEIGLMIAEIGTWREVKLASRRSPGEFSPGALAWSTDGERIACGVMNTDSQGNRYQSLIAIGVRDGREQALSPDRWQSIGGLAWMPNDQGVVMAAAAPDVGAEQIYFVDPRGMAHRVTNDLNRYVGLSLTADGRAIAAVQSEDPLHVWVAPSNDLAHARALTRGAGRYSAASWTPDGGILTDSDVSGAREIWKLDVNGGRPVQVTAKDRKNMAPLMTPDNRFLIVQSARNGRINLWRTDPGESAPVQLTNGEADEGPQLSPDGRWVFYSSRNAGQWTIWKVAVEGGPPVQVVEAAQADSPAVSPDGRWLAYRSTDPDSKQSRMVVMPVEGGAPVRAFDLPQTVSGPVRWAFEGMGLTYVNDAGNASEIWYQPMDGAAPRQLTSFQGEKIHNFSWSPDGRFLAVTRGARVSDAVLITNVR